MHHSYSLSAPVLRMDPHPYSTQQGQPHVFKMSHNGAGGQLLCFMLGVLFCLPIYNFLLLGHVSLETHLSMAKIINDVEKVI